MRSSKSRSRNKSRGQRSLGNIVNRVFDSSGPEGKVRGTPQQIIDKYLALARDAQLSGDRVAEQSFLQHAEHYTRMLGEAQREQAERQAQQGGGNDEREDRQNHSGQNQDRQNQGGHDQPRRDREDRREREDRRDREDRREAETADPGALTTEDAPHFLRRPAREERPAPERLAPAAAAMPEAVEPEGDGGPVETPEARTLSLPSAPEAAPAAPPAAEEPRPARARTPRPRRRKTDETAPAPEASAD